MVRSVGTPCWPTSRVLHSMFYGCVRAPMTRAFGINDRADNEKEDGAAAADRTLSLNDAARFIGRSETMFEVNFVSL